MKWTPQGADLKQWNGKCVSIKFYLVITLSPFSIEKTTFYDESILFQNNWRRISNRVRLFVVKPIYILITQT